MFAQAIYENFGGTCRKMFADLKGLDQIIPTPQMPTLCQVDDAKALLRNGECGSIYVGTVQANVVRDAKLLPHSQPCALPATHIQDALRAAVINDDRQEQ
jgi:hypothetical protein